MSRVESIEGWLVDMACIRTYPQQEMRERAREHTRECCLHGHCVESGYGLVDPAGRVVPLDPAATPLLVAALQRMKQERSIRFRIEREQRGAEMVTTAVTPV